MNDRGPGLKKGPVTVDELTARISALFLQDPLLQSAVVRGEVAELKKHSSGHVYFTLVGEGSRIYCALFKNYVPYVPKWPMSGDEVLAEGSVSLYAPRGSYQLIVRRMTPIGRGAAERARLELELRLEKEGIFDPRLKRPLPPYPQKVAVVTSPTGAALRDVLAVAGSRLPSCELVIVPVQVQGYEAPDEIAAGLAAAAKVKDAECVMLVRGGGSRDDLTPFDDERVVRAVRSCPLPVITGVGHEIDETLSDKAADARAPTPSAAAERLFPDRSSLLAGLSQKRRILSSLIEGELNSFGKDLASRLEKARRALEGNIAACGSALGLSASKLGASADRALFAGAERLAVLGASLNSLSPLKVFDRGYSLCEKEGQPVKSASALSKGDQITLRFADGSAEAEVTGVSVK
jgi:exodeoxyribonuclease VII large subunit